MSDKYKLVKFKDGSTSVVARRVRLGKPIFHGTWDECLWHQDAVDHPDPETPILMPLERPAARFMIPSWVTVRSKPKPKSFTHGTSAIFRDFRKPFLRV